MMLKSSIEKLMRGENLPAVVCQQVLDELLTPTVNPLQVAAFLVLLRTKQETASEIAGMVTALRNKMLVVPTKHKVLDIVGTGGDGLNTINISTGSAMLAASCGVKIAKHGNRAVSSLAGSADVLEALGVNIQLTPEQISKSIDEVGIGFCYSPNFHPMTQTLKQFRKELNVATTFNILGPLLNPANAAFTILGVMNAALLPIMADVLMQAGTEHSMVVHGMGLDEISCVGPAKIIEIKHQQKFEYILDPLDFGLDRCSITDLQGGGASVNAQLLLNAFKRKKGPIADTLILNAAIAMYLYGMHLTIDESLQHAKENLFQGEVLKLLNNWIEFSHDQ